MLAATGDDDTIEALGKVLNDTGKTVMMRVNAVWETGTGFVGGAFFLGPVVSYVRPTWWIALSVMPQVAGFGSGTINGLELDEHERINVRLLAGFDL